MQDFKDSISLGLRFGFLDCIGTNLGLWSSPIGSGGRVPSGSLTMDRLRPIRWIMIRRVHRQPPFRRPPIGAANASKAA